MKKWLLDALTIGGHVLGFALPAVALVLGGIVPFVAPTGWPYDSLGAVRGFWLCFYWSGAVAYFGIYILWHLRVRRDRLEQTKWYDKALADLRTAADQEGEKVSAYFDLQAEQMVARVIDQARELGVEIEGQVSTGGGPWRKPDKLN